MRPEKRQGEQKWKVRQPGTPQSVRKKGLIWGPEAGYIATQWESGSITVEEEPRDPSWLPQNHRNGSYVF